MDHIHSNTIRSFCFVLCLCVTAALSAKELIKVPHGMDHNSLYTKDLLNLVIANAGGEFEVQIAEFDNLVTQERALQNIEEGNIDVMWTVTSKEIEKRLIPIRIPLFKGLFGYRVSLVHSSNRDIFKNVDSLADLKQFTLGQGKGWADTEVLLSNGLNVMQTAKWQGLFHMADGKRFDAYPRGLHEPANEMPMIKEWGLDLMVEEHILLVYRMPFYLFVNPKRPELARKLEEGFEKLVASGEFAKFFIKRNNVRELAANLKLDQRKRFFLDNPHLPDSAPIDRAELWLEPSEIFQ